MMMDRKINFEAFIAAFSKSNNIDSELSCGFEHFDAKNIRLYVYYNMNLRTTLATVAIFYYMRHFDVTLLGRYVKIFDDSFLKITYLP